MQNVFIAPRIPVEYRDTNRQTAVVMTCVETRDTWRWQETGGICESSGCRICTKLGTLAIDLMTPHYWTYRVLHERDYVTFGSLLSQIRLSSATFVRPTQGVESVGNISSPFCTLAILW